MDLQPKMENERVYQTNFPFLKFWNFEKLNIEIKRRRNFPNFKNGLYVKEHCLFYRYSHFQVDILWNDPVLVVWRSKMTTFDALSWYFYIFSISKFCPIWTVEKVFHGHFCVLIKNRPEDMYCTTLTRILSLTFPDPVTLHDLYLKCAHWEIWVDLRSIL